MISDAERKQATVTAVNALTQTLDSLVADEAAAMAALAIALGERIGAYASTQAGLSYGLKTISNTVAKCATRAFNEKDSKNG